MTSCNCDITPLLTSLLNRVTIQNVLRATGMMELGVVGADPTREGDLASSMGLATKFLTMSLTQAQFTMCELITLGGMVSLLQTPLAHCILVIWSLLPRVYNLLYAVLYILSSDVISHLYSIEYMWFEAAICICHSQSLS
jgi:hypothetical protein